jgi:hypothetical protein
MKYIYRIEAKETEFIMIDLQLSNTLHLNSRIPLLDRAEVCVVGGGVAGLAAALKAGESGIDTVLVEERGALAWEISHGLELYLTSGVFCPPTLTRLLEKLTPQNAYRDGMFDPVATEVLCDQLLTEANVRLHFRVFAGSYESGLIQLTTKSGPMAIHSDVVVDATEESRLAYSAFKKEPRIASSYTRSFLLCAVRTPIISEKIRVDADIDAVIRPTLWPNEAHVQVQWVSTSPDRMDSESRRVISRTIATLRKSKVGFETASLSLSAHEPFALIVPKINVESVQENIFIAGPAVLGRKPLIEERASLGEQAVTRAMSQLHGINAKI